jgi:hypothetical protein
MKIIVPENLNPIKVIRRAGYGLVNDRRREASFARRLGHGFYPRFHAYINSQIINLHLDQKQASYEGFAAHSGEYDSEAVRQEAARIEGFIDRGQNTEENFSALENRAPKSFFSRFFGG